MVNRSLISYIPMQVVSENQCRCACVLRPRSYKQKHLALRLRLTIPNWRFMALDLITQCGASKISSWWFKIPVRLFDLWWICLFFGFFSRDIRDKPASHKWDTTFRTVFENMISIPPIEQQYKPRNRRGYNVQPCKVWWECMRTWENHCQFHII